MSRMSLKERIRQGLFLLDGAMGTQLIARGVEAGVCNDYLNVESPDVVLAVHEAYLQAGSDAVLTNTFGANRYALARHGYTEKVAQVNTAGAQTARRAAGEEKYVLGDIGPSGDFLEPLGALKAEELKATFAEQTEALAAGGVDGFIIETMTALEELTIAVEAAKSVGSGLPVFASMAFDQAADGFRTMMGIDVEAAISEMLSLGVDVLGYNCGSASLDEYVELSEKFVAIAKAFSDNAIICAQPNAGRPELIERAAQYAVSPVDFASAAERIHSAGVTIIGGCCGTTPAHIEALAKDLKG